MEETSEAAFFSRRKRKIMFLCPAPCSYFSFFVELSSRAHSLWLHGLQHVRLPCSTLTPEVCSSLYSLTQWWYLIISFSAILFSFCLPSFPSTGSFSLYCIVLDYLHVNTHYKEVNIWKGGTTFCGLVWCLYCCSYCLLQVLPTGRLVFFSVYEEKQIGKKG